MRLNEAKAIAGTLSAPSKMPCFGTSLPAEACKTGSKLAKVPGTVCHGCYARKGFYMFPSTIKALEKRLEGLHNPNWVEAMATLVGHYCKDSGFFRWHDSGDIQGVEHLWAIVEVCQGTPKVRHWLPTKEYTIVRKYLRLYGSFPNNLLVRVSGIKVDTQAPSFPLSDPRYGIPTSTVHNVLEPVGFGCPAPTTEGKCGSCRACWDREVANVSYKKH